MTQAPASPPASQAHIEALRQYGAVRAGYGALRVSVLHIAADQTLLAIGDVQEPSVLFPMAIGSSRTASEHFRQDPPSPGEIENAIMAVEDEVSRARDLVRGSALFTLDPAIRQIALLAGVTPAREMLLGLAAVEQTFDRFAGVALGRPAASEGLPAGGAFAATLLILRELMQHLQFPSITVLA